MFAVICIPNFALQAVLRAEPSICGKPVALIDPDRPKSPVIQLNLPARNAGLTEGLSPTQSRARCSGLFIRSRSSAMEKTAAEALLQCAYAFSPDIEASADGVITLDLKGFKNLCFHDYAGRMVEQIRLLHLDAQVGVASNRVFALFVAKKAKPILVLRDEAAGDGDGRKNLSLRVFMDDLAIEEIDPSPETLRVLKQWGIHTVESFVALGEEAVADRLGVEAISLFERATGGNPRPLRIVRPEEIFDEAIDFEHEIETAEPLLLILRRFVEQISVRITISGKAVESLALTLRFTDGPNYERTLGVPEPTADSRILFRMLQTHLEDFRSEHAITGLKLSGKPCLEPKRQLGLFETSLRNPNHFGEMMARLAGLVGKNRLGTPVLKSTHQPDAFEMKVPDFESQSKCKQRDSAPQEPQGQLLGIHGFLPLRRFRPPLAAEVMMDKTAPASFRTPNFSATIRETHGPWRSSGDWWDNQRWSRDEWDVRTADGALYRLFEEDSRWFVEGIYD